MPTSKPTKSQVEIEEPVDSIARRTFISLLVALGFFLLIGFIYLIRNVIVLVIIATVIAMALAPMVGWLVRHRLRRGVAVFLVVLLALGVILGLIGAVVTPLASETTKFINTLPNFVANLNESHTFQNFDNKFQVVQRVQELSNQLPGKIFGITGGAVGVAGSAFSFAANLFVVLTLVFFLLLDGPAVWKQFIAFLKPRSAARADRIGTKVARAVGGYVTGNLLISVVAGIVAFTAMSILSIPFALPLAIFVAIFDLIPLVGAAIATVLIAVVALSQSVVAAIAIVVIMVIYQQIEGNVIQPMVYSRTVNLSPLWILVASLIGATLGGIIGILLAIPAAATVQIVAVELLAGTATGRRAHIESSSS